MQFVPRSAVSSSAPLQLMEPVDQLAPYLHSLGDIGEALDAFERLADLVLSPQSDCSSTSSPSPSSVSSPPFSGSNGNSFSDAGETGHYLLAHSPLGSDLPSSIGSSYHSPSSPGGFSCISSSQINCCASCTSQWNSIGPSSSISPYSSSSSSSSSSSTASSASSTCSTSLSSNQDSDGYSSSVKSNTQSSGNKRSKRTGRDEKRRQKNATAADRYRKKIKSRRSGLSAELDREQERNARLRQSLKAKLVLYIEFADLLAQNTRDERDWDLAAMGSRSLSNILDNIRPQEVADEKECVHLEQLMHHFKQIMAAKSALGRQGQSVKQLTPSAGENLSEEFEYDFYNGRLVL